MSLFKRIGIIAFLVVIQKSMFAQCAMCKAVVEADLQSGGAAGAGINSGILYLMGIPYLLMGIVGFFIYKHFKKNNAQSSV